MGLISWQSPFSSQQSDKHFVEKRPPRQASIPCGKSQPALARSIISEVHAPEMMGFILFRRCGAGTPCRRAGQINEAKRSFAGSSLPSFLSRKRQCINRAKRSFAGSSCQAFFQESGKYQRAKRSFAGSSLLSFLSRKRVTGQCRRRQTSAAPCITEEAVADVNDSVSTQGLGLYPPCA